ncbi:MAG TPA: SWIB/MDM2 domain-containing protein [Terriglobales bacterium]|jgi:chromatin remodeling complex protein RSC6|nr:SWIB/MDM2 domain-containing protein [Terriglobales bacterium]
MPNNALNQKLKPSDKLSAVLGDSGPVTRADAVKRLWDYVKEHDLQNPKNRREILADDKLRPLFGKEKITMFEVGKILNSNLTAEGSRTPQKSSPGVQKSTQRKKAA